jgi:ribosome-binding protein aMBF1 (putative translation factor)
MNERRAKRIHRELTPSEEERLKQHRQQIAQELPDLQARDQMRNEARNETTLSGELRRAIHSSGLSLAEIAARVAVTPLVLDEFLTGERTLRSDVIDRLAGALGYELNRVQ